MRSGHSLLLNLHFSPHGGLEFFPLVYWPCRHALLQTAHSSSLCSFYLSELFASAITVADITCQLIICRVPLSVARVPHTSFVFLHGLDCLPRLRCHPKASFAHGLSPVFFQDFQYFIFYTDFFDPS